MVLGNQVTRAGGINGVRRATQFFLEELIFLNDFGLKSCMVVQRAAATARKPEAGQPQVTREQRGRPLQPFS